MRGAWWEWGRLGPYRRLVDRGLRLRVAGGAKARAWLPGAEGASGIGVSSSPCGAWEELGGSSVVGWVRRSGDRGEPVEEAPEPEAAALLADL